MATNKINKFKPTTSKIEDIATVKIKAQKIQTLKSPALASIKTNDFLKGTQKLASLDIPAVKPGPKKSDKKLASLDLPALKSLKERD